MTQTIDRREEVVAHFAASLRLTVASPPAHAAREAELELEGMGQIATDLMLPSHPPLCVVADVLRVVLSFDEVRLCAADGDPLRQRYRLRVLAGLVRDDPSIRTLARAVATRGRHARRIFARFFCRELARTLNGLPHCFPFRYACPSMPSLAECRAVAPGPVQLEAQAAVLEGLVRAYPSFRPLFNDDQVLILSYLRDERDIPPLREYHAICAHLEPMEAWFARRARFARYQHVQVEDQRSPSMGGFVGLASGGDLDRISTLVPSELALMDVRGGPPMDLFDINLLERRLLFFKRDQNIDVRRRRCFHVVFYSPASFDYRPAVVPGRWPNFFLAVWFDVIRFFRDALSVRQCPFYFVFLDQQRSIESYTRLIEAVRLQDFPDVTVRTQVVNPEELSSYLARLPADEQTDHTVVSLSDSAAHPADLPAGLAHVHVSFGAHVGGDTVRVAVPSDRKLEPCEVHMEDEASFKAGLNRVRSELMARVADGRARQAYSRRSDHAATHRG